MRLCLEHTVKFVLPAIESAAGIAGAMKAVTSALAGGVITPGEAATIRAVVDTFVRPIETSDFERRLQLVEGRLLQLSGCRGRHVRCRAGRILPSIGEILLQIRCRWRNVQQSIQLLVAVG
jgi:hypothetical protein